MPLHLPRAESSADPPGSAPLGDGREDPFEEPLIVVDWTDEDDEEIYVDDGVIGVDAPPPREAPQEEPLGASIFPSDHAERVRSRAWQEYARGTRQEVPRLHRRGRKVRSFLAQVRALAELLLLVAIVGGLNLFLAPLDPGFRRLEFNPYLLPVVLLGIRYGTFVGMGAGVLSSLVILGLTGPDSVTDPGALVLPGILIVLGTLAGALSRNQGRRLAFFRTQLRKSKMEHARLQSIRRAKDAVIRDLQNRIEIHAVSMPDLYRMSRGMVSTDPKGMYGTLLRLLSEDFGVERAAVYERNGDGFVLSSSIDRRALAATFEERLALDEGLSRRLVDERRVVSIVEEESRAAAPGPSPWLLAGPILKRKDVHAIVMVFEMPLLDFDRAALERFRGLLGWAGESLSRAPEVVPTPSPFDPETGAYRPTAFRKEVERELSRSRRSGSSPVLVSVRIDGFEGLSSTRRAATRELVASVLAAYSRESDQVGLGDRSDTFLLLMPTADPAAPEPLAGRIREVVDRILTGDPVRLRFESLEPEGFVGATSRDFLVPAEGWSS
jgi:hypothetical protein